MLNYIPIERNSMSNTYSIIKNSENNNSYALQLHMIKHAAENKKFQHFAWDFVRTQDFKKGLFHQIYVEQQTQWKKLKNV